MQFIYEPTVWHYIPENCNFKIYELYEEGGPFYQDTKALFVIYCWCFPNCHTHWRVITQRWSKKIIVLHFDLHLKNKATENTPGYVIL
jgi:hypothetical protein